jgi:diaminohydroxyphosphoribosylaminopyrimidine deaminase/5-amino-6-(5-phosphoribosylamino)uracil reductase
VLVCRPCNGRVDLTDLWGKLGKRGIQSVLLEGGSRLAGEALKQGLIDECVFFYAPKVIGSDGFSPFTVSGVTGMNQALQFTDLTVQRMGCDIIVTARPEKPCLPV